MKRHGTYTEIFRNDRWAIFKAQGGLNQVLAKNTIVFRRDWNPSQLVASICPGPRCQGPGLLRHPRSREDGALCLLNAL
jgi:hypothetical protein